MDSKTLKSVAIAAMTMDHLAWAFFPLDSWPGQVMHITGRIAGPIMFCFIAEGYTNTRSVPKYAARLAAFAMISQTPYIYFWTGKLPNLQNIFAGNVLFTLFLGLLALWVTDRAWTYAHLHNMAVWPRAAACVAVALLCMASALCDWSYWGIFFILAFWAARKDPDTLLWCVPMIAIARFLQLANSSGAVLENLYQLAVPLVLPLLYCYSGKRGKGGKWFFYLFYPVHLMVIGIVKWRLLA